MHKRIIEISVNDEYVVGSGVVIGAAGSDESVILRVAFGETWAGLNIYATFRDSKGESPTVVMLMPSMLVPGETMKYDVVVPAAATKYAGKMSLVFSGFAVSEVSSYEIKTGAEENIKLVYRDAVINTTNAYFRVLTSDFSALDVKDEAEATVLEKVLSEINGFDEKETERRAAEVERESAEAERKEIFARFREDYFAGKFKGEKGDPGSVNVVDGPGDSETDAMSQKATTEYVKDYIPKVGTRNLLNVTWKNASINNSTGALAERTDGKGAAAPEFIPVVGGETYTMSWSQIKAGVIRYVAQYKADHTYISQLYIATQTFTLDAECAFVRISLWGTDWETLVPEKFQMELGDTITPYTAPLVIDKENIDTNELVEEMQVINTLPIQETLPADVWEMGAISPSGINGSSTLAFRTIGYIRLRAGDLIEYFKIPISFRVYEYDPITFNLIVYDANYVSTHTVENDSFVRIVALMGDRSLEDIANGITIHRKTNKYLQSGALPYDELHKLVEHHLVFDYAAYGFPVIEFSGDISSMSKDDAVTLSYKFGNRSGSCTLKWQGSSSLGFPKKNYTVKFDTAFQAPVPENYIGAPAWGEQKKYCLKADWVDFSHCRNVVTARLWGRILARRSDSFEHLAKLKGLTNGGAIDGFLCFVVINGEWQGIYNFNIPKDGWMLGMGEGTKEAIVCADFTGDKCAFKTTAKVNPNGDDFEVEYVTDEDNADWVQTSLNTLIQACIDCDGTDLSTIEQYIDINSAIDYYILVAAMGGHDNIRKNYLLSTYDGTKWFFTPYDMDCTWGMGSLGSGIMYVGDREYVEILPFVTTTNDVRYFKTIANTHRLMELIYKYMPRQLIDRYKFLRKSRLSSGYLEMLFESHIRSIPMIAFEEEAKKWKTIPSTQVNNVNQIINWAREKLEILDYEIELLESSLASTNEA